MSSLSFSSSSSTIRTMLGSSLSSRYSQHQIRSIAMESIMNRNNKKLFSSLDSLIRRRQKNNHNHYLQQQQKNHMILFSSTYKYNSNLSNNKFDNNDIDLSKQKHYKRMSSIPDVEQQQEQQLLIGNDVNLAMKTLYEADCVCFDVDCTITTEDGIDMLASYLKKGTEVSDITNQSMNGHMSIEDALELRLNIIQPSKEQMKQCMINNPYQLTSNIDTFIDVLMNTYNKDIYFISGGLRILIEPVALQLGVPLENITAIDIEFDSNGNYDTFDKNGFTSQDMGKPKVIQLLIDKYQYKNIVMIGDGHTDTQTKPPAKSMIGYGGVIVREQVKLSSDWFIHDYQDLIDSLHEHHNNK